MVNNLKDNINKVVENYIKTSGLNPTKKEVTQTKSGFIHIFLTVPEFSKTSNKQRDQMFWSYLENNLSNEEIIRISACILLSPEEEAA